MAYWTAGEGLDAEDVGSNEAATRNESHSLNA